MWANTNDGWKLSISSCIKMLRLEWWKLVAFAARGWIQELSFFDKIYSWPLRTIIWSDSLVFATSLTYCVDLVIQRQVKDEANIFCTKVMEAADSHFWWKFQTFSSTCASTRFWVIQSRSDKLLITRHIRKARLFGREGKRDSLTGGVTPLLRNDPSFAECWARRSQSQARVQNIIFTCWATYITRMQNTTFHNLILGILKLCKMIMMNDDTIIKLIRVTITDICDEFRRPILMLGFAKSKEQGMRVKGAVFLIFSLKGAVFRRSCFFIFDWLSCQPDTLQANSMQF